jgi:MerR family transcriptional regulator/heat shock protein HspR
MTAELGMNLAGVERVLALEQELERMRRRVEQLERKAHHLQEDMQRAVDDVHRSYRAELVPYKQPKVAVVRVRRS